MENELLKIFDEHCNEKGVATREEVHRLGHWHETFHCWIISREEEIDYIYLQIRSANKRDYPNLLDITAAGHLLANEEVYDGIREVQEELGIEVAFGELISLGIIPYSVETDTIIDKELAHVYVYRRPNSLDDYKLQTEEVSGVVRTKFKQFAELWLGKIDKIQVEGFEIDSEGKKVYINKLVTKNNFVHHETSYYEAVIRGIENC
ncbi:NUDIX hydrolase [Psychrobacillus vulpis]|uniref:NUDIX hydrolase n=1 Tax=Psychrobacillus vulpis TaxID=2325572 RepID=A0A544TPI6_9BACI|nr:NUDIX domain-containing protein [Psychrobacillus vulpis]TQR19370.1 NUDIX hydrolase [Psychrobacillus vulpis]